MPALRRRLTKAQVVEDLIDIRLKCDRANIDYYEADKLAYQGYLEWKSNTDYLRKLDRKMKSAK
jgi:hypothetical protein